MEGREGEGRQSKTTQATAHSPEEQNKRGRLGQTHNPQIHPGKEGQAAEIKGGKGKAQKS